MALYHLTLVRLSTCMPALTARRIAIGTAAGAATLVWVDAFPATLLRSVEVSLPVDAVPDNVVLWVEETLVRVVADVAGAVTAGAAACAPAAPPKVIALTIEIDTSDLVIFFIDGSPYLTLT
ncbi:hypothetical protein CIK76_18620 [Glutamicibacter sp. BW80]|nr:hypothetical protein CIK76_18620 [Glutamicibacter sp. BW80]